ncbi:MAG TPA: universal stress protein, partial [Ktedonobacteraceae bacterium]|nr:universal stress protein [Ktedonobacteraceae bacterium]
MFQRFLVPLDGSRQAEKAIPVAADLARVVHGTITLARIIEPPTGESTFETGETPGTQITLFAEARNYLETLLDRYEQELAGLHLILEITPGKVPSSLFAMASQQHLDLIVMCSREESALKRWVLGSMAQEIFRHSPLPVLALHEHDHHRALFQGTHPLRILVPYDRADLTDAALTPLFQLLGNVSPSAAHEIHLLHVVSLPPAISGLSGEAYIPQAFWDEEREKAEQELHAFVQRLAQTKPTTVRCVFKTKIIMNADIAGTLLSQAQPGLPEAEGGAYDLIAMATHGRTGLKHLLLGSVTERVFGTTT